MKIRDIFNIKDFKYRQLVIVSPDDTVSTAIRKLSEHDRGSLPVCNDAGDLVGIVTERDILRKCFSGDDSFINKKICDVMTGQVAIATPQDDLDYAIDIMRRKRIRHIPIVDDRKVIGIISMRDIMGVQYEETKAEIRYAHLLPRRSHYGGTKPM